MPIAETVGRRALARRQPEVAAPFQLQRERARRHVLGTALRIAPSPAAAKFLAQAGPAPLGMLNQQIPDQFDVRAAHLAPLHDHDDACHGSYGTTRTPFESSTKISVFAVAFVGGGNLCFIKGDTMVVLPEQLRLVLDVDATGAKQGA